MAVVLRETWDVVCKLVDNYGDVGIAWRLARLLAADGSRDVRLVVDGLSALARIEPGVDAASARQRVASIDIVSWSAWARGPVVAADVVVEMLGCGLPDVFLDAMEARGRVVWIDYEHLSAEDWVDDFHGLPSPRADRSLVKHFFYPGFGPRTGGLPIEAGLEARRRAFVDDAEAVSAFRHDLGVSSSPGRSLSLFAYPDAPVAALLDVLAEDVATPSTVLLPSGVLAAPVAQWFTARRVAEGRTRSHRAVSVTTIPFVDQPGYDRLLWSCDFNCVRGEDSFVRAQLAARPFVWAAYRQSDEVHLDKLAAFEARHTAAMPEPAAAAQRAMNTAWNAPGHDVAMAVRDWLALETPLRTHAEAWRTTLATPPSLIDRLLAFVADRRQEP